MALVDREADKAKLLFDPESGDGVETGPNALVLPSRKDRKVEGAAKGARRIGRGQGEGSGEAGAGKSLSKRARRAIAKHEEKLRVEQLLSEHRPKLEAARLTESKRALLQFVDRVVKGRITNANFISEYQSLKRQNVAMPDLIEQKANELRNRLRKEALDRGARTDEAPTVIKGTIHTARETTERGCDTTDTACDTTESAYETTDTACGRPVDDTGGGAAANVTGIVTDKVGNPKVGDRQAERQKDSTTPEEKMVAAAAAAAQRREELERLRLAEKERGLEQQREMDLEEAGIVLAPDVLAREWRQCKAPLLVGKRAAEVEQVRAQLPAFAMEDEIVEAVNKHLVTVITGGTGCGKSTQVPQFLLEAGFSYLLPNPTKALTNQTHQKGTRYQQIIVTQPRRVAAISLAHRVSDELTSESEGKKTRDTNMNIGSGWGNDIEHQWGCVGYQIRDDKSYKDESSVRLKFVTDGILLKTVQSDFLLRNVSCVVLDEVHERSANCDILLGLLSRIVFLRQKLFNEGKIDIAPLRLVMMSATLNLCDFLDNPRLFPKKPRHVDIPAKTFPVTIHFNKETPQDYVAEARRKVVQIHRRLPKGSILVFLTGREEILALKALLRGGRNQGVRVKGRTQHCPLTDFAPSDEEASELDDSDTENENENEKENENESGESEDLKIEPETTSETTSGTTLEPKADTGYIWQGAGEGNGRLRVMCLFANMSKARQREIFETKIADGERVVILATNVAETSVTLPNIRYVVDCGFCKERLWTQNGAMSNFEIVQISKASSNQRAGRAGRLGPGHCYRLYSSAVFEHEFRPYPTIQLLSQPLDSTLLLLLKLGIPRLSHFAFPNPPENEAIAAAVRRLLALNCIALDGRNTTSNSGEANRYSGLEITEEELGYRVTPRGAKVAEFPVSPRYAAILVNFLEAAATEKKGFLQTPDFDVRAEKNLPYLALAVATLVVGTELFDATNKLGWSERLELLTRCGAAPREKGPFGKGPKPAADFDPNDDLDVLMITVLRALSLASLVPFEHRGKLFNKLHISEKKFVELLALASQLLSVALSLISGTYPEKSGSQRHGIGTPDMFSTSTATFFGFGCEGETSALQITRSLRRDSGALWMHPRMAWQRKERARELPDAIDRGLIKFFVTTGLADHVAVRHEALKQIVQNDTANGFSEGALSGHELRRYAKAYRSSDLAPSALTFFHPSSALRDLRPWPPVVCYDSLVRLTAQPKANKGTDKNVNETQIQSQTQSLPKQKSTLVTIVQVEDPNMLQRWLTENGLRLEVLDDYISALAVGTRNKRHRSK